MKGARICLNFKNDSVTMLERKVVTIISPLPDFYQTELNLMKYFLLKILQQKID